MALAIALKVGKKLKANGFEVVYTRTNDNPGFSVSQTQNLAKRASIANTSKADLFVSIQEEMQVMLDVFYAGNRITTEQYQELTALLIQKEEEKTT